jgi:peptide/nickel transport system substrate-binding protein
VRPAIIDPVSYALLALALPGAAACARGPAAGASAKRGGEIRVVLNADIRGTTPGVDRDSNTDDVMNHIVEGLVAYREDMSVGPLLAERSEVSPDARVYTFPLRSGLRFHNGAPVTAAEAKWSWTRLLDPQTGWPCREWYDGSRGPKIESIGTPDDRTIVFTLSAPSSVFLHRMANFQCLAAILHPDSVKNGAWDRPVGTGPFKLGQWRRGEFVLLERFDAYTPREGPRDGFTGAKVALADAVRFMVVPDGAAARAALYSGQVDLLYLLLPSDLAELKQAPRVTIHQAENFAWSALLMQTLDPLLRDVRVRRAIAHAIDLQRFAEAASLGVVRPNPSAVPRASPYYGAAFARGHDYDLARAAELLRAAGYDGRLVKIQTNKRFQAHFDVAVLIQAMLRKAGLNVELEVLEWTAQLNRYLEGKFQLMSFAYSARADPVLGYETFLGLKKRNAWIQWENAEAQGLIERASIVSDAVERRSLFEKVHELMLQDVPILNLYNSVVINATGPRIEGYRAWASGKPRLWGVRVLE